MNDTAQILAAIKPYVMDWVSRMVSSSGGGSDISAHASNGNIHHLSGMTADDHSNYLHLSNPRTVSTIHTFSSGLKIGSGTLGWDGVDDITLNAGLSADDWVSGLTGWHISDPGVADFRSLTVDELHAKAFIADIEQALAGGQIISKSVAILAADFTIPATTGSITVEDLPGFPAVDVFVAGDVLRIRVVDRSNGGLQIADVWGTVSGVPSKSNNTQTWTFTRTSGTAGTVVYRGAIVLDYGASGDGYWEVTTLATDSPYAQIVTWATNPWTPGNLSLKVRMGNLNGITDPDVSPTGWGLYTDNAYLKGTLSTGGGTVILNSNGITIDTGSDPFNSIKWDDGSSSQYVGLINTTSSSPTGTNLSMLARADTGKTYSTIQLEAQKISGNITGFTIQQNLASPGLSLIRATVNSSTVLDIQPARIFAYKELTVTDDITPYTTIAYDLGTNITRFRSLYAAELRVTRLVAEDVVSTIGGSLIVGETTKLTAAVADVDVTISVEHNSMAVSDIVFLEEGGFFEAMRIISGPTGTGPYSYGVTRDLDGTGANDWPAGAAVVNTGVTGDGFIHLYSQNGVYTGTGPTIVGNVRLSNTYNGFLPFWATGNLENLYDYSTRTYGAAFGVYAANMSWLSVDASNGIRIMNGTTTQLAKWDLSGNILIGQTGSGQSNVYITAGAVKLRTDTTVKVDLQTSGNVKIGSNTAAAATTHLSVFTGNQTYNGESVEDGDLLLGDNSSGKANALWDKSLGQLKFRGGTITQVYIDTDGSLTAGAGAITMNADGLQMQEDSSLSNVIALKFMRSTSVMSILQGFSSPTLSSNTLYLDVKEASGYASFLYLRATADAVNNKAALVNMQATGKGGLADFRLDSTTTANVAYAKFNNIPVYINETANTFQTIGLTINQGSATDEWLAAKQSGVAHGMTTYAETDTTANFKVNSSDGGMTIRTFTAGTVSFAQLALATTVDTNKLTTANGAMVFAAYKKSGTAATTFTAGDNTFVFKNGSTTDFILAAGGNAYANIAWGTFDKHNDIKLLDTLETTVLAHQDRLKQQFGSWLQDGKEQLEKLDLARFGDGGSVMLNVVRMHMLEVGALRQSAVELTKHAGAIQQIMARLERLEAALCL